MIIEFDDYATCFSEGDSGRCGIDCAVFQRGDCEHAGEIEPKYIVEHYKDDFETAVEVIEMYNDYEEWMDAYREKYPEKFI
ncbi:hypothetical protein [Vibrio phage phiKT1024]|nr:hypothetical protein [Vibrio phage phiKT1024]